jgi:hypothetical protein
MLLVDAVDSAGSALLLAPASLPECSKVFSVQTCSRFYPSWNHVQHLSLITLSAMLSLLLSMMV